MKPCAQLQYGKVINIGFLLHNISSHTLQLLKLLDVLYFVNDFLEWYRMVGEGANHH